MKANARVFFMLLPVQLLFVFLPKILNLNFSISS